MNLPDLAAYLARPGEAEIALQHIFRDDAPLVIFDVGACEGEDTVRYALRFPNARLFAFEPLPSNQALVRANFARYGVGQAELVPMALSDRAGEAVFYVSSGRPPELFAGQDWNYGNKSSSLLPPARAEPMFGWIEFKEAVTVPTDTLDHFCIARGLDHIDFIHMDVQGAEHLVLDGAAVMLPRTTALWLEVSNQALYVGQPLRSEVERRMRDCGFLLCFEVLRQVEGDQFYVNMRHARTWSYVATQRTRTALLRARAAVGRLKHHLFGNSPP